MIGRWSIQQEAIFAFFANPIGNLVVRARAGTGKTTTIIEGVRRIPFDATGNPPRSLVSAFNKRIADELSTKLAGTGADAKTLHALGYMFLRGAWGDVNVNQDIEDERLAMAVDALGESLPTWEVRIAIKKLVGIAKGAAPFGTVNDLANLAVAFNCDADDYNYSVGTIAAIARKQMDFALTPDPAGRVTFDDMLFVPAVNGYGIPLYDWVIVDEAQDMNASQLMIARAACKPTGHMVIVGDDKQAIYGFRGADSRAVDRLKDELCAQELTLTTTYRCPTSVVQEAAKLVPDFEAAPDAPAGAVETATIDDVLTLADPGDVILSRVNAPLVPLCLGFIRRKVPARIEGRDVGKLLAARAKKLKAVSVEDFHAKLGKWATRACNRAIAHGRCVDQKLREVRDIEATLLALSDDCDSVADIYTRCEQMFGDLGGGAGMVVLSSIHKAKGLEWNRVFLLADTLYCGGAKEDDDEERNIAYVAVTRARQTLVYVRGKHAAAA